MAFSKKNLLSYFLLIAVVIVVFIARGDSGTTLSFENDAFTLDGPKGYIVSVPLDDIVSLEYRETLDTGVCAGGETKYGCSYGLWENEEFGLYDLCAMKKIDSFIIVTDADGGVLAFNYESDKSTESLHRMMTELLDSRR